MYRSVPIEEDFNLQRISLLTEDEKPSYAWRDLVDIQEKSTPQIIIQHNGQDKDFSIGDIAETIGKALTDLLLSKNSKNEEIFTHQNQSFVSEVSCSVIEHFWQGASNSDKITISRDDLYLIIEKALIEKDAYDVAKSMLFSRTFHDDINSNQQLIPYSKVSTRLTRRNGKIVAWDPNKIEIAVRKAFLSLGLSSEPAREITEAVNRRVIREYRKMIQIEEVQDLVQEELMNQKHFKVAEAYILYRSQRAHLRQKRKETETSVNQASMVVVHDEKEQSSFWDGSELKKRIEFAITNLNLNLNLNVNEIETELLRSVTPEIKEADWRHTIILNAKSLIEKDADFAKFAGRILLSYIYEETLPWKVQKGRKALKKAHQKHFKAYLQRAVDIKRLNPQLLEKYDIEKLALSLEPDSDLDFEYLGIQTLYDRYLIVDKTNKKKEIRIECPQFFWMRVAMGIFLKEEKNPENLVLSLYKMYRKRRFCSSTPTLFNSGTLRSQLSSCYLYKVDDSIDSIMIRGIAENAFLSKWAGGLGGSWTAVRGSGSYIKGTNGESQGVIPFLKLHNDQLVAVNQGGKRRGSGCAYLETWHSDILEFLELRRNTGDERRRTHDMNTANWIPDLFMKRVESRKNWHLFRSNEVSDLHGLYGKAFEKRYEKYEEMAEKGEIWSYEIPAIELWKKMLKMLFETGHPWITFKDPCNLRSPQDHIGVIHSSNLCTEITLNTSDTETAVCNLGSLVLDSHIDENGNLQLEMLKETIDIAIRALDNVIDINFYPTEAAKNSNTKHRPIGLGVMGLQNALYKRKIPFSSQEAIEFNDEFMEAIAYYVYNASSDLAKERGVYSSYKGSKWDKGLLPQDTIDYLANERNLEIKVPRGSKLDWEPLRKKIAKQGMRNSNVIAIAPTATISNIVGTTSCIEPNYKNLYVKSNLSGEFTVLNKELVKDLKLLGLWNDSMLDQLKYYDGELADIEEIPEEIKLKHQTVFDVDYKYILDAAARRQKWIDQSQSVNLFLREPSLKKLSHMYRHAWHNGLKTTYYLRTLQASNIEKATIDVKKQTRGVISGTDGKTTSKKEYTTEEQQACSIEAMLNDGECEACQ